MISNWLDSVVDLWRFSNGKGGTIPSYGQCKKANVPAALADFPCAVSWVSGIASLKYGVSSPTVIIWNGLTLFFVAGNESLENIPKVTEYHEKIIKAAAAKMTLGGLVAWFQLNEENPIAVGAMQYGEGPRRDGLMIHWQVKENVSGTITVAQ